MTSLCGGDNTAPAKTIKQDTVTLIECFEEWCKVSANDQWMCQPMGGDVKNVKVHTWSEARAEVMKMVAYIASLGLEPGSRIALMSKNCKPSSTPMI